MKKLMNEFKEFALRGNVFDLAIGVVIGGAFTAIVTSLVSDVITPIISFITGSTNFEHLVITLKPGVNGAEGLVLRYGNFLDAIINFIIIAFVIFMVIKAINGFKRKATAQEVVAPAAPSEEVVLLSKIYEELKNK